VRITTLGNFTLGQAMGRRRFEMFEYRQVLLRLRAGDSDLGKLMGRPKR
jgi:hypothetical protein